MQNLKIRVNSIDEGKEIQNILESKGFKKWAGWSELGSIGGFIWTDSDMTYCDNEIEYFDESPREETTLQELREMANPMKEYLDANRNYEFVLSTEKDDGFIEIPEGAIRARFYPHDPDALEFEGDFCQWWHDKDNEWINYENYSNTLEHSRVVWQREQDEPFLTPECTLNDQYAEIEKVRQDKKHERNSSAWDIQIGGGHYKQFKIQPMQFALENKLDAAQQNVIKYIMRHSFKNGKQDLEKAKHYIDLMIEFYYGENNNG